MKSQKRKTLKEKEIKKMAGYSGYSMSNNAVNAYSTGERPLSKWTKAEIIEAVNKAVENEEVKLGCSIELLKKLTVKALRETVLYESSWHHTSNHFNKTDFYSLDIERLGELRDEELLEAIEKSKVKGESKKTEPEAETWECSFIIWSGSRNYPKATEYTEVGTIKGNWFYRQDGSKKSVSSNGFKKLRRM